MELQRTTIFCIFVFQIFSACWCSNLLIYNCNYPPCKHNTFPENNQTQLLPLEPEGNQILLEPIKTTNDTVKPVPRKLLLSLLSALLGKNRPAGNSGNCNCGQRNTGNKIVNGEDAVPNEFPWRCYIKSNLGRFICGCSIISNRWILTAAHCTIRMSPIQEYSVVAGAHQLTNSDGNVQQLEIERIYDHPSYTETGFDYDISLLRLRRDLTFNYAISPICLPFAYANDEFEGTTVTSSGWGAKAYGFSHSNLLQKVDLPVLTTSQCSRYYPSRITERMICTYEPGKDTCQGDSGGSIDLRRNGRYYHIGVVAWGAAGCAGVGDPGVYSKTTKYLNWIKSTTGEAFCEA